MSIDIGLAQTIIQIVKKSLVPTREERQLSFRIEKAVRNYMSMCIDCTRYLRSGFETCPHCGKDLKAYIKTIDKE